MSDTRRLEDLKRRVQQDPASIAFAALADEYRRAGLFHDAIETCRAGLLRHPAYLSARVTLGRSLIEVGEYDEAQAELELVIRSAPDNLAAIRGLAEIHERRADAALHAAMTAPPAHDPPPTPAAVIPLPVASHSAPLEIVRHEFSAPAPPAALPAGPAAGHSAQPDGPPAPADQVTPARETAPAIVAAPPAPLVVDPVVDRLEEFLASIERARASQDGPSSL